MATTYKTPGVYIVEQNAFSNSVTAVPTSIPAFIGYTEKGKGVYKIGSLAEYETIFGKGPGEALQFGLQPAVAGSKALPLQPLIMQGQQAFVLFVQKGAFYLYNSLRLFFLNGGGSCYIVSVGNYTEEPALDTLSVGLLLLEKENEPSIMLIPDAVSLLAADHARLVQRSLAHCSNTQNRVVILDVYGGAVADVNKVAPVIDQFRQGTGQTGLSYGAVYFPWLNTGVQSKAELSFLNLPNNFISFLENTEAVKKLTDELPALRMAYQKNPEDTATLTTIQQTQNALLMVSEAYRTLTDAMLSVVNVLPASGAMAGVYAEIDNTRNVSRAPANVQLAAVLSPVINLTDQQQMALNVDTSGKAVNAIRAFQMQGVLVWGAKTLDDNSFDFRYINVRRTVIMLEQSIKLAVRAYVFAANDINTWTTVKNAIQNFLTDFWKTGGLAGAKAEDAFAVQVGLGSTMTANDILEGIMKINVMVAVSHPAEFIVISFEQEMQKS